MKMWINSWTKCEWAPLWERQEWDSWATESTWSLRAQNRVLYHSQHFRCSFLCLFIGRFGNCLHFPFTTNSITFRHKTFRPHNIVSYLISFPGAITLESDWLKISWHGQTLGGAMTFGKLQMSSPRSLSWATGPCWRIVIGRHCLPPSPLEKPLVFQKSS